MDTQERIIEIIDTDYNAFDIDVNNDTTFEELGLDSLDAVELLMDIESAFDIDISDDEFDKLLCVNDVIECVEKHS